MEGSDMDIDEVHVNKKPKFSSHNEIEIEKDCMIIDPVLESIEKVPTFKINKIPSIVVLEDQEKLGTEKQPKEQSKVNILSQFEAFRENYSRSNFDLYS